jgi:hypothetical protein
MSNLYRSAISAKLAKLPSDVPAHYPGIVLDEDEEDDPLGDLPGSGLGPPAMQVINFFKYPGMYNVFIPLFIRKGPLAIHG